MKAIKMMTTGLLLLLLPLLLVAEDGHVDIVDLRESGRKINLSALLASNQVTLVSFHADWCPACTSTRPFLHGLARENPDVRLVQVDIASFESPVATQFAITGIPQMRVYLPDGHQVGKATSSFGTAKLYTKKAARQLRRSTR